MPQSINAATTYQGYTLEEARKLILDQTNAARAVEGLQPLVANPSLDNVAQAWSETQAAESHMYHNPNYSKEIPAGWYAAAENVAYGQSVNNVVQAWINSPGHYTNIMRTTTNSIGIGLGIASNGQIYYTQNFAEYPNVVQQGTLTPSISQSNAPYGTTLTLTIRGVSGTGVPLTGGFFVREGSTTIGVGTFINGVGTLTLPRDILPGSHSYTITASASNVKPAFLTHNIEAVGTNVVLSRSGDTVTATVVPNSNTVQLTGWVELQLSGNVIRRLALDSATNRVVFSGLAAGTYRVIYTGALNVSPSMAQITVPVITPPVVEPPVVVNGALTLSLNSATSAYKSVAAVLTVKAVDGTGKAATGTFTVKEGTALIGTGTFVNGQGTIALSKDTTVGTHIYTVTTSQANIPAKTITQSITKATSKVSLSIVEGKFVVASVTSPSNYKVNGQVQLYKNGVFQKTTTLSAETSNIIFNGLESGTYRVVFTGDNTVEASEATIVFTAPVVAPPVSKASIKTAGDVVAIDKAGNLWNYGDISKINKTPRVLIGSGWAAFKSIKTVDWNGDGVIDIIAQNTKGTLHLYKGGVNGGFSGSLIGTGGWAPMEIDIAKWKTTDKYPSIIAKDTAGNLWVYPNASGGALSARTKIGSGWGALQITVLDFDTDGKMDFIAKKTNGELLLYRTNGTGSFISEARKKIGSGWTPYTSYTSNGFNGADSKGIVARYNPNGALYYYPIDTKGNFGARVLIGTSGWNAMLLANN